MLIKSYFLDYRGANRIPGRCFVEIYDGSHGKSAVLTEITGNPGPSVTNACEQIANTIALEHPEDMPIDNWIEHYPRAFISNKDDTYDLIMFTLKDRQYTSPRWRRISEKELSEFLGIDIEEE